MSIRARWLTLALAAASSCGPSAVVEAPRASPAVARTPPSTGTREAGALLKLPREPGQFAPALTRVLGGAPDGAALADVAVCADCHHAIADQWGRSAHAFASFSNPVYRASVDRMRREVGFGASQFCAGCHDPALLVDGAMLREVAPDDPRAHAGVSCLVCHSASDSSAEGNGSYTLGPRAPTAPDPHDQRSVDAHRQAMRTSLLDSAAFCASCHRAFLSEATGNLWQLPGTDDVSAWRRSSFAGTETTELGGPAPFKTCQNCHMPRVEVEFEEPAARDGQVASHFFAGAHSWLAMMREDMETLAESYGVLKSGVSLDIAAVHDRDGVRYLPTEVTAPSDGELVVDVVVSNEGTGHRFPGGTRDIADTWLEAELTDRMGRRIAAVGMQHELTGDDGAHRLFTAPGDQQGRPLLAHETHQFRARLFDTTIAPHDARVVRFSVPPQQKLELPLRLTVYLKHRTRSLAMQRVACRAGKAEGDRKFREAAKQFRHKNALDPCPSQPVLWLAQRRLELVLDESKPEPKRAAQRLYRYGKGLLTNLQEHLDELRPVLNHALTLPDLTPLERARFHWLAARLAARQGRLDEALGALDRARALLGDHPALERTRAEAYSTVWRWRDAAQAFERATRSPGDYDTWAWLARARGSAGDPAGALAAAQRGLSLEPRSEQLLRSQALAVKQLASFSEPAKESALAAYLAHRAPPEGPKLRARCLESSADCAREQLPLHVHRLEPVARE